MNNNKLVAASLFLIGTLILGYGASVTSPLSTCVQSVANLTPNVTICPGASQSSLDEFQFNSVYMGSPSTPIQVTVNTGSITIYYELGSNLAVSSFTLGWCNGATINNYGSYVCSSTTPITTTNNGCSNYLCSFSGVSPTLQLNEPTFFVGKMVDSSGASYSAIHAIQYNLQSYPVTFDVKNSVTGSGVSGAQIAISLNGNAYSTATTDSTGSVTAKLPYDQFSAVASANGYSTSPSQSFTSWTSPTVTFAMFPTTIQSESVKVILDNGSVLKGATVQFYFTKNQTAVGPSGTTNSSGKVTINHAFDTQTSYYVKASATYKLPNGTSGSAFAYSPSSLASQGELYLVQVQFPSCITTPGVTSCTTTHTTQTPPGPPPSGNGFGILPYAGFALPFYLGGVYFLRKKSGTVG